MKKWLLLGFGALVSMSASAENLSCGYKDYFHLSDQTHPGIYIVSAYSESDIYLELVGPRSFVVRDTPLCRSGYAHVTVAYDNFNYCVLDIKDGPLMMHPTVSAACSGIRYINTTYDGLGSYSYSINLD